MDLASNNLQWLICHKTQQTKPTKKIFASCVCIKTLWKNDTKPLGMK